MLAENRHNRSNQFRRPSNPSRFPLPFFETNNALKFDRTLARGMRLNVPSGNAVRFEPGEVKSVELVALGGSQTYLRLP